MVVIEFLAECMHRLRLKHLLAEALLEAVNLGFVGRVYTQAESKSRFGPRPAPASKHGFVWAVNLGIVGRVYAPVASSSFLIPDRPRPPKGFCFGLKT